MGFQKRGSLRIYCKDFMANGIPERAGTRNAANRPHVRDLLGGFERLPLSGDEGEERGGGQEEGE